MFTNFLTLRSMICISYPNIVIFKFLGILFQKKNKKVFRSSDGFKAKIVHLLKKKTE